MKRYPAVVVDWIDSSSYGGWRKDWETHGEISTCRSLGFLVERSKRQIKLLQSSVTDGSSMMDGLLIPTVAVKKLRRLPGVYSADKKK